MIFRENKKGQVWTTDFILGLVLFLLTLILGTRMIVDIYSPNEYNKVHRESIQLSDKLISPGYPTDWNESTVIMPGISDNNRINESKLSEFEQIGYYRSKALLHMDSDFIFFFQNSSTILNLSSCIYGYDLPVDENCTPTLPASYNNLMKIDRTIIYGSKIYMMTFYVWD